MSVTYGVKTTTAVILRVISDISNGRPYKASKIDKIFNTLSKELPYSLERAHFDAAIQYGVEKNWIGYDDSDNKIWITPEASQLPRTKVDL